MYCPRCRHDNPTGTKFCGECGARLSASCTACGASNPPSNKFCGECGQPIQAGSPPAVPAPSTYTPKHLAEKILTSKAALEGERKQVTVLFADLKGSMELLADRDPEEARKLLDPVLERMMEAVHRYEGTVNQVMGDGIMALFGAPLAHEDHAVRACYAALDMQAAMRKYAEQVRREHGVALQVRVGLNSGAVVVRAIGSDLHMDYTAVGQTTHLASRVEQLATPGSVLLTEETLRLAEGYIQVKPLGPVPVKGIETPVETYELIGAGVLRSRLHAAAARGLTRFVGREGELEQLRHALSRASSGQGQVVAVVGEPGVGKSRLVWEVTHSHRTHGWLIQQASSVSYGKATPYLPIIDLLKGYFKIQGRDEHRDIREKVIGKLIALDDTLKPILAAFLGLLDVPVEDSRWQALDPSQRRQRTLEAIKRLLVRETHVQPVLAVFEDLHWLDAETQALLDSLVESAPTARLLILVNYRPEYEHRWGSKTYYTQLRLDPLAPESASALLHGLVGSDPALEPLTRLLIERTQGNPFFLEETVRTLVETDVLAGEPGAFRLAKPLVGTLVPATVQAVLAARMDRLPREEKRLLQTASVVGKDVPFALLEAIVDMSAELLHGGVAHLQAAEFLYETALFPDREYTFKHALTHEVAYESLLRERRRELHARVIAAIERLYPDRLTEHAERLCHHAERAERWEEMLYYARKAGLKALGRSANRDAAAYFERALGALARLPDADLSRAVDLRADLRTALWAVGDIAASEAALREAERLARLLGDPRRMAEAAVNLCHSLRLTGRAREASEFGERGLALAESLGEVPLQAAAHVYAGATDHHVGQMEHAQIHFERAIHLLAGDRVRERAGTVGYPAVTARAYLAWAFFERGRFSESLGVAQEAIRVAEALEHPYSLVNAWWMLAYHHAIRGEWAQAQPLLEASLAHCRTWALSGMVPMISYRLGYVYAAAGQASEGIRLLEEASAAFASLGFDWGAIVKVPLGQAYFWAGRVVDALETAEQAVVVSRDRGERLHEAHALRLFGEASIEVPKHEARGGQCYLDALALATELGMRPLVAHCHLGLGELYRRAGDRAKAQEHLTSAATLYRDMEMGFWLQKAAAELTLLD